MNYQKQGSHFFNAPRAACAWRKGWGEGASGWWLRPFAKGALSHRGLVPIASRSGSYRVAIRHLSHPRLALIAKPFLFCQCFVAHVVVAKNRLGFLQNEKAAPGLARDGVSQFSVRSNELLSNSCVSNSCVSNSSAVEAVNNSSVS